MEMKGILGKIMPILWWVSVTELAESCSLSCQTAVTTILLLQLHTHLLHYRCSPSDSLPAVEIHATLEDENEGGYTIVWISDYENYDSFESEDSTEEWLEEGVDDGAHSDDGLADPNTDENESESILMAFKLPASKEDRAILERETSGARSAVYCKNASDRLTATTAWRKAKELRRIPSK